MLKKAGSDRRFLDPNSFEMVGYDVNLFRFSKLNAELKGELTSQCYVLSERKPLNLS